MSSDIKFRRSDCMESQTENETLRARIREVEDENQELRAQSLLQNRTITELRNEIVLLRIQITEMADTSVLLRERVRTLVQNAQQRQENSGNSGPVTVPPLMAPPPVPPPLPPARIRISPRQVGAGEALTTPLGVSLSSPPRHRIKRDCRQGLYKSGRIPYHRFDGTEPGPSSQFYSHERPNYFVGLKIIPQFQSFLCTPSQCGGGGGSDSASDSSGSDENPQLMKKPKSRPVDGEASTNPSHISKGYDILKNVRNIQQQKVRQSILQNYNFSLPSNNKFIFPIPWDRENKENAPQPSTSGNEVHYFQAGNPGTSERTQPPNSSNGTGGRNPLKVSDCVQYTFPTIHEGLHHSGLTSVMGSGGSASRVRKYKKNIPYIPQPNKPIGEDEPTENEEKKTEIDSESVSSSNDTRSSRMGPLDFEQDGFQADESSNCLTSTDNSLEQICVNPSRQRNKD